MTILLRPRVHSIMFGTRRGFEILGMVTLQAFHKLSRHLAGQERVFAPGLLPAPPTRVAEDIYVWRPERESLILVGVSIAFERGMVFGASLVTDGGCDLVN